jgi:hypothetical protein
MSAEDCLGLCLAWTRTKGGVMTLQIIFGMADTSVNMYLRFGRRIIIEILQDDDRSAVQVPSLEKIQEYKDAVKAKHPLLTDVWCCMDGLKLYLQKAGDGTTQNNFYNGWTHDHYVTNVIVFCPDGTIPICCLNVPGSVHDSVVAEMGDIYEKLELVDEQCGGMCAVNSAFSMRKYPFFIKSSQRDPDADDAEDYALGVEVNKQATSMRQSAEWGMRALQSSFPRMQDRFKFEKFGERRVILKMMILVYNLRARMVGINQIKNHYMPALLVDANEVYGVEQGL